DAAAEVAAIRQLVERWRAAWSDQRVEDYLDCYADDFRPAGGRSRRAWARERRQRLLAPGSIDVEVTSLAVELRGGDRARAYFHQRYRTETLNRGTWKSFDLVRGPDGWKIQREQIENGPPS
ncbi:MAG: nuclear transport factor 2 family protein, partial [Acidobacteria bacterium]